MNQKKPQEQKKPKRSSLNDIFSKDNNEVRYELVYSENGKRYTRIIEVKKNKPVNL